MRGINVRDQIPSSLPLPHLQITGPFYSQTPQVTLLDRNDSNMSEFVQNWICKRHYLSNEKPTVQRFASSITIPVYKQLTLECNNLLIEVNRQISDLEESMQIITIEDWYLRKNIIDNTLKRVNELTCTISQPTVIKGITQRIRLGGNKRSRRKKFRTNALYVIGSENTNKSDPKLSRISKISSKEVEQLITGIVKLRNLRLMKGDSTNASTEFDDKVRGFRDQIVEHK